MQNNIASKRMPEMEGVAKGDPGEAVSIQAP
jgi:hypothetical protein